MSSERFVVLGMARPRAEWFSGLSRWATSGLLPVEFVKCVGAEEVRARLASGRSFSALVADAAASSLDRDLIEDARTAGCPVLVVEDPRVTRDWIGLGASALLSSGFSSRELLEALGATAAPIGAPSPFSALEGTAGGGDLGWRGRLITLIGPGGVGTSTLAMGLAQQLGRRPGADRSVVLADLTLCSDSAMYHDVGDVVPGFPDLVDAHRHGRTDRVTTRATTFDIAERSYHLLLGLRRRRDWTMLRPRAVDAALDSLRRTFATVVVDADDDLDGETTTGSADMDDRNSGARAALRASSLVLAVGTPGLKGTHGLLRTIGDLLAFGVPADRLVPVFNHAPRRNRARAEATATLGELIGPTLAGQPFAAGPLFISDIGGVEDAHRGCGPLPPALGRGAAALVESLTSGAAEPDPTGGVAERAGEAAPTSARGARGPGAG